MATTTNRKDHAMPKVETPAPEFTKTQKFISTFSHLPTQSELDIATIWTMGTWTFSPASPASPDTYPYLYITGGKGSGKSNLALDLFGYICRNHIPVVQITGPTLFRMIGTYDEDSGQVINHYPTLAIDEIDAAYGSGGSNDEAMRGISNAGYRRGATVRRAAGKTTIDFPVYCPKAFIGIDNGRLPDTITDRSIRITMKTATPEQMRQLRPLLRYQVEDDAAELQQELAQWAQAHSMVFREYEPEPMLDVMSPRQWEIARPLIQLAKALRIERRIRVALADIFTRKAKVTTGKVALYQSIMALFDECDTDRLTSRQILDRLYEDGVRVPGDSGKGLAAAMATDGIQPKPVRLPEGHPGRMVAARRMGKRTDKAEDQPVQRGYFRHMFDDAFVEYVLTEEEN